MYRELTSSRFISSFKNIRKPGTYKYSEKRFKTCQNYLGETNKFAMSNSQDLEIHSEIDCHSVDAIYYLKCKMCNEKETYIGKTKGDNTNQLKVRINLYISDCKTGDTTSSSRIRYMIVVLRIIA